MKTREKVGFAVVGLGSIAVGAVLPALAHSKRAQLVALVSRDKRKASRLAKKFSAKAAHSCDEFAQCLRNPEIVAVYVATPPGEHLVFAAQAAAAGKHVLCEKPLGATVEQSAEIVKACRDAGVLLMTAYRKYFEPSSLYLKQLIRSGALGRIDIIHTSFSELHTPGISVDWLLDSRLAGGGPLMDLGIYCVNTTRWLVDEDPVEVTASSWSHDKARFHQVEEGIVFRMRFPSGLVVQGSSTYGAALSSFLYLQGTKGWASLSPAFTFDEERHFSAKIGKHRYQRVFKVVDEFALEIDAFAAAVQARRPAEADGLQGHRDMVILNAIYDSARKQESVMIGYQ
jgi:predicted dehydrogenase